MRGRGQTQELTLPLTFVALSNLPDAIEAAQLANVSAAMTPAERRGAIAAARGKRDELSARIASLVASWTPALCPHPAS